MTRILIIGASSGIGAAVARRLAQDGLLGLATDGPVELILHGRDEARLVAVRETCLKWRDDLRVVREAAVDTEVDPPGNKGSVDSEVDPPGNKGSVDTEVDPPGNKGSVDSEVDPPGIELLTGDVVAWAEDVKSIPAIEPVDAVVWSAGICELAAGQMIGLKALRRTLAVNLEAPLVVLSYFYRKGIIRDGGTIVLLGSQSAHDAGEGFSVYAASKGGLASAARVLGKEFSRRNIAVHCLEPGTVDTPMTRKLVETFGGLKDGHAERMVSARDVAEEVLDVLGFEF